jgi:hypothetical protein
MLPFLPPPGFVVPAPTPVENFVSCLVLVLVAVFLTVNALSRPWFLRIIKIAFPFLTLIAVPARSQTLAGKYIGVACAYELPVYAESITFSGTDGKLVMKISARANVGFHGVVDTKLEGKHAFGQYIFTRTRGEDAAPWQYVLRESQLGSKLLIGAVNWNAAVWKEVLWKDDGHPLEYYLDEKQSVTCKSLVEGYIK